MLYTLNTPHHNTIPLEIPVGASTVWRKTFTRDSSHIAIVVDTCHSVLVLLGVIHRVGSTVISNMGHT